jgi:DNA recombination protein RmuC
MNVIIVALNVVSLTILVFLLIRSFNKPENAGGVSKQDGLDPILQQLRASFDNLSTTLLNHRDELRTSLSSILTTNSQLLDSKLDSFKKAMDGNSQLSRQDASNGREELERSLTTSLKNVEGKIEQLTDSNSKKQLEIIGTLQQELEKLRKENELKLEQMRATVDEKLQGTLDKRLGESFKTVSDQLKQVYEGLGEMQNLASGVGDLKRVLTNVKNRGGWGEVQLGRQLEDMFTPQQYAMNVIIDPSTREQVEYAVILPGREDDQPVYLPIDAKFPQEDYERLLTAQESGSLEEIEKAGQAIEKAIRQSAKDISEKYIRPPFSTDFGIMYLPTEGLFAEVIRRPGLCSELQTKHRVLVTGPTTLMAILNSLQIGFKTLAVQKRTSEVWRVLASVQSEFKKYGAVWEKLEKQLNTAQNTVKDARLATKKVERELGRREFIDGAARTLSVELEDLSYSEMIEDSGE